MHSLRPLLFALLIGCGSPQAASTSAPAPTSDSHAEDESSANEDEGHHGHGAHHHRFDDPQAWASRWEGPERDAWQEPAQIIEWMAITPGQTAVDIGAGTGYFLPHLSAAVGDTGHVISADIEPAMVEHLRARIDTDGVQNASAQLVTANDPLLEQGAIDRVLLVNTWHHVEGRVGYAEVLMEALTPAGTLTIVEYNATSQPGPPVEMRLSPEEVISELNEAGYEAELLGDLERQYVIRAVPMLSP